MVLGAVCGDGDAAVKETRDITAPQPGFWAMKLAKRGVEVGACIRWEETKHEPGEPANAMERSRFLAAFINGKPVALHEVWHRRGRAIDVAEYRRLVADRAWARQHAPHLPEAEPSRPVDLETLPLPF